MKDIVEKETKLKAMEEVWGTLLRMEHQFDRKFPGFSDYSCWQEKGWKWRGYIDDK